MCEDIFLNRAITEYSRAYLLDVLNISEAYPLVDEICIFSRPRHTLTPGLTLPAVAASTATLTSVRMYFANGRLLTKAANRQLANQISISSVVMVWMSFSLLTSRWIAQTPPPILLKRACPMCWIFWCSIPSLAQRHLLRTQCYF